ncbi:Disease resistance protein (CC-NBS-LRR class) family [Rhynchospora pubera]|uniref:Disease resistance protein (CC-NBS-LRR class) family n=1 Tax=Rhynchospora pubera TaxID=906938 RepID=A0AAV8E1L9_9POAL|nr:Disease resistance protein (CC-NBS-LRR class) family [Rhynchospora pubera]
MAGLGAYALMSSLLNLLSNLLPEVKNTFFAPSSSSSAQAPDARAVEDDLRRLERMLMRIKATLYDAEERNIQDQSIRLWLQEIRDLGREAEYILEEYMYEVYRAQVEARNSSKLSFIEEDINMSDIYSVLIPDGMVDRIRGITSRFEEIAKHREALHLPEEDAPLRKKIRYTPTFTSSSVVEQNIFGREEEKENVINALLLGGDGISVLPIVGKGGIGKTTVAQLVYNDKKMQGCFDLVGWICV